MSQKQVKPGKLQNPFAALEGLKQSLPAPEPKLPSLLARAQKAKAAEAPLPPAAAKKRDEDLFFEEMAGTQPLNRRMTDR